MTCRVVICDDDPALRLALSAAIEYEPGFRVVAQATNGIEAIEACRDTRPNAILLDLTMPVMDGISAISGIRHVSSETKIVVFSGSSERETDVLRAGAHAFVLKGAGLHDALDFLRPQPGGSD